MDESKYTRVTQILSPFSGLSKVSPEVLNNAADRGSRVHIAIESIINGIGCDIEEDIRGYIDSFMLWKEGAIFLPNPKRFFNDEHMLTGECDALYTLKDNVIGTVLVDFKTSARESKTWRLQGSAYSWLAKQSGYNIATIQFVRLKKDGKFPQTYFYEEDFGSFLILKDVYDNYFKHEEELNYEYI